MNRVYLEWETKLMLLRSIARSQEALARILESVADVSGSAGPTPKALREHVRVLSGMQSALLHAVHGTSWRPSRMGTPASPWLAKPVRAVKARRHAGAAMKREVSRIETQTRGPQKNFE